MKSIKTVIIIVSFNGKNMLRKGIDSILTTEKSKTYKIVVILHKGGGTTSKIKGNLSKIFYRNRWIYFRRYCSFPFFIPRILWDIARAIKNRNLNITPNGYKKEVGKK